MFFVKCSELLKTYNNYLLLALLFSLMMTTSWEVQTKSVSSSRMKPLTKMVCTVSLVPLFFPPVIEEGLIVWVGWLAVCWTGWLVCVCGNCDPLPRNQSHITADFVGKGHSQ